MAAVYPGGIKTYTAIPAGNALPYDVVQSFQDEITAIETFGRGVILHDASFSDASAHNLATVITVSGRLIVTAGGQVTVAPFYPNGGSGVAYRFTILDPDTGWVVNSAAISFSFQDAGFVNTYTVAINSGTGVLSIQRTAGATSYRAQVISDLTP